MWKFKAFMNFTCEMFVNWILHCSWRKTTFLVFLFDDVYVNVRANNTVQTLRDVVTMVHLLITTIIYSPVYLRAEQLGRFSYGTRLIPEDAWSRYCGYQRSTSVCVILRELPQCSYYQQLHIWSWRLFIRPHAAGFKWVSLMLREFCERSSRCTSSQFDVPNGERLRSFVVPYPRQRSQRSSFRIHIAWATWRSRVAHQFVPGSMIQKEVATVLPSVQANDSSLTPLQPQCSLLPSVIGAGIA